jgi:hypothetical protein
MLPSGSVINCGRAVGIGPMSGRIANSPNACGIAAAAAGSAMAVTGTPASSVELRGTGTERISGIWLRSGSFEATMTPVAICPSGITLGARSPFLT